MRSVVLIAIVLGGALLAAIPTGTSHHCESRLSVYSRASFTPMQAPPNHAFDQTVCTIVKLRGLEDHTLAPNADQVLVRVNGVFGPALTNVSVYLDGMGFDNARFTLFRANEPLGPVYVMPEWIYLPDPTDEALTATVHYPTGQFTVTYARNPTQLPLPQLPPFPDPPSV